MRKLQDQAVRAKFIDEIIPNKLKEEWNEPKTNFIKLYYYWDSFITEFAMDCLVAYMDTYKPSLFNKILDLVEGITLKVPLKVRFDLSLIGSSVPDEEAISKEVDECTKWLEDHD